MYTERAVPNEHTRSWPLLLGVVADDVTGATDLGATLTHNGMEVVEILGLPTEDEERPEADAVVCALETRTAPVEQAVAESVAAARWLLGHGARQLFFKYSSTFDSTEAGNIGPVAEALLDLVEEELAVVCPAYPEKGWTVYQGHLFVYDRLLSESGMRHHPLTPMTDADLVRLLGRQCRRPDLVDRVAFDVVDLGSGALQTALEDLQRRGVRLAVVDAVKEDHLWSAAAAVTGRRLVTGGSGVARGLPANFRRTDELPQRIETELPDLGPPVAVLAGSCSEATRAQVAAMTALHPTLTLNPMALATEDQTVEDIASEARRHLEGGAVLVHSSAPPDEVRRVQQTLGRARASELLEEAFAALATRLVADGARSLVVAGRDTAGAVARALGLRRLRIGPEIDPGVPWTLHLGDPPVHVALKSGSLGSRAFFLRALERLQR
jgi:uncharacterized protein YgbK (DUF1537 family)